MITVTFCLSLLDNSNELYVDNSSLIIPRKLLLRHSKKIELKFVTGIFNTITIFWERLEFKTIGLGIATDQIGKT